MISLVYAAGAPVSAGTAKPRPEVERADGSIIDIVMLQLHVIMAMSWLIVALVVAFMAIPRLRRVPSALALHALQVHRGTIISALWGLYLMALSTGIFLLFQQAAYDPPLSGSEWNQLDEKPYALPYYYALYGKIGLFAIMGLASVILAREASKASKESEAAGGPVEEDVYADDEFFEDIDSGGYYDDASSVRTRRGTRLTTYAASTRTARPTRRVRVVPLWMAFAIMTLGTLGIAFCITLIKYFHELSKAAVVYEILRLG